MSVQASMGHWDSHMTRASFLYRLVRWGEGQMDDGTVPYTSSSLRVKACV